MKSMYLLVGSTSRRCTIWKLLCMPRRLERQRVESMLWNNKILCHKIKQLTTNDLRKIE
jgi:hypothetical protein